MITIENNIFTELAELLRTGFENIFLTGEYVMVPSRFPTVSIEEADNYTAANELDTGNEKYTVLMYEINIYTNKAVGKKTQAKEILAAIDNYFHDKNFTRLSAIPVPSTDGSIYRITARYRVESDGINTYRYTI